MKGCIVTSRGYYQWNPHLDCSVDVFEVNDLSELARKESDAEKRSRIYEQIVNLYDGRLLPQSASEPWVESVSVRLHGQYRTAILNLLELCKKWGESTRIVTLCTRALELDPYEERLYLLVEHPGRDAERAVAQNDDLFHAVGGRHPHPAIPADLMGDAAPDQKHGIRLFPHKWFVLVQHIIHDRGIPSPKLPQK